ncbi:MAG: GNAT family N-acetyltransferase [Proteobacteria bacterium]|nr:GNAT family N-acetyltransferase [Pseudomonadota bacterium]
MMALVPFAPVHFTPLLGWFPSHADLVQWGGPLLEFPLSHGQLERMLAEGRSDPPARLCWTAVFDGELAGHVQLAFDWRNGNAVLSRVAIAPEMRGRRLAGRMIALAIDKAFGFQAIERLELNVFTWNTPAIRTYEALGFTLEGVRRASARVEGERWDTAIMSLLRTELSRATAPHAGG